jgi:hypothetical protein
MVAMTVMVASNAFPAIVSYTSTPEYLGDPEPSGSVISVSFTSELEDDFPEGETYRTTATYGAMIRETLLRFHTSDAFHVYGPTGSSDSWGTPQDFTTYAGLALAGDTTGGQVTVGSTRQVTAVDYEELRCALSGYRIDINYGPLEAGTELRIFTTDAFHVYGPYGTDDWGLLGDNGTYASMILESDTSGGTVSVSTLSSVSSVVAIPEPATVGLLGLSGLFLLRRRRSLFASFLS